MTEKMWCIVSEYVNVLPWTIRRTRENAIKAELEFAPVDMTWREWKREQGYRTARCTVTLEK